MAFRAGDDAQTRREATVRYFLAGLKELDARTQSSSERKLRSLFDELGPAVDAYPVWHPLVSNQDERYPVTTPDSNCGYSGLDHTRYFANGFITCPYTDGAEVIESVNAMPGNPGAIVEAEPLDFPLYRDGTQAVVVKCLWNKPLLRDGTVPVALALPLLLEKEIPCWRWAQFSETWETMHPYFLGSPHGKRSSLFVNQETGQKLKNVWDALVASGMFGPVKNGR